MNTCILVGKICSQMQFDFILNSKNISVCIFDIQLLNGSIIKAKGYNEIADYCYSSLGEGMNVQIEGCINNKYEIILDYIEVIN